MGEKTEQRTESRIETHQSQQVQQTETKSTKVEFAGGEERRKEALERRQEFLKQQEDLHMKITSSQFNVGNAKTRQQLEEEREAFIKNAVLRAEEERKAKELARQEEIKRQQALMLEQKA